MRICIPPKFNKQLKSIIASQSVDDTKAFLKMNSTQREAFLDKLVDSEGKKIPEMYKKEIADRLRQEFKTELSIDDYKLVSEKFANIKKIKEDLKIPEITPEMKQKLSIDELDTLNKEIIEKNKKWTREYVNMISELEERLDPTGNLGWWEKGKSLIKEEVRKIADTEGTLGKAGQITKTVFNALTSPLFKSIKASIDASYLLRQGFKVLTKDPKQWYKSSAEAFQVWKKIASKKEMTAFMNEFKATIMADPDYELLVNQGKTAIGVVEDIFPKTIAERTQGLGHVLQASNEAFTVFIQGARYGIAKDLMNKQIKQLGRDLTKKELQDIGFIANSMTGRGSLGRLEASSGFINRLLFSGRYIRSSVDTFIMPFNTKLEPFARQEALKHSLWTLGSMATLIASAEMVGFDVETDPRSSKFGRVKVPGTNNYIDLTAGTGGYIALAAKELLGKYKDSKGRIVKLNDPNVYKGQTRTGVLGDWATNKLSPAPGILKQVVGEGELYGGVKPTLGNVAREAAVPITVNNWYDYFTNEDLATALLLSGSDAIGLNVSNTYK